MGCIYLIRNTVNDKCYIGQAVGDAKKTRIPQHLNNSSRGSQLVKQAVAKYGKDAFVDEILHDGIIPEFLDMLEIEAIAKHNTVAPNGYNLTHGGEGGIPSKEVREKLSKYQSANNPKGMLGKKHTPEARERMSKAQKGKVASAETRRKLSKAKKGKKKSAETRRKMSEYQRANNAKSMLGKKHTPETRRKMSERKKGVPRSQETRKILSEVCKTPMHHASKRFYLTLPSGMSLTEKRKQVRQFSGKGAPTVWKWVKLWESEIKLSSPEPA